MTHSKTLLAVDGNSLVHRSFHALASSGLTTSDGRPSWAVKGFVSQLLGAVEKVCADAVVVGFDDHTSSVRKTAHPHYKATRKPKPPELGLQISTTIDLLRAAGVHVVVPDGLEADDVMASAAAFATRQGWHTVIVTSDRDSFALIDEHTSVLRLITGGLSMSPTLTPKALFTMYGIHPSVYREYAAMRGDTSDNLTGIAGVGEKTAAKLLEAFGSVTAAFADVDAGGRQVAARLGKAMVPKLASPENREAFWRNVEIMTMRTDIDLALDLDRPGAGLLPLEADRLLTALDSLELASLRQRALTALCTDPQADDPTRTVSPVTDRPAPASPPAQSGPRALDLMSVSAMAGSSAPPPASWDETLW